MRYFNLHTHRFTGNQEVLELVNQYPWDFRESDFYSVGIHPWHIERERLDSDLIFIESKLNDPKCLAIGECGLDKRIEIPFDLQADVFRRQLILAENHRKPVVLHCVAAYQEAIEISKEMAISIPMIIHGFSKNEQVAKSLLDNGFYLSFGKYLLRNPELAPVFRSVPDDRFFLETDMIDENIREVYEKAAICKGMSVEKLQNVIRRNFEQVFANNPESKI